MGKKDGHENAVHVLLPKSGTTWVYLNLDTYLPDFKFWMAHELGHVYSPSLSGNDAEKFADAFAGALLFPSAPAQLAYSELLLQNSPTAKMKVLNKHADAYGISCYSVYKEANSYASAFNLDGIEISPAFLHGKRRNLNVVHGTVSELLWGDTPPTTQAYFETAANTFKTPFFDTLADFLAAKDRSAGFVQTMLDIPLLDAKALRHELLSTRVVEAV